ncbi:MAG: carbohydrate kinase family protein [bacterium]|nr:carbohydrate kinase family protein [bacterium]
MYDIITIGSATVDVFLKSSRFPLSKQEVGGKIEIDQFFISSGGGGTNTAAGFARLGLKTACIARFGDDFFGQLIIKDLEKESFDRKYLIEKKEDNTDYSTVLVNPDGSRTILVYRGKTRIDEEVFPWDALRETKWLYMASIEGNVDLLLVVVKKATEFGVKVVLNPGSSELEQKEKLLSVFPRLEALVLNKEEADSFGLKEGFGQGPNILVITNGRQGVKLFSSSENLYAEALRIDTVDETGAGDAFSVGFVGGLVKGLSCAESLKLGLANGAAVVSQFGGKTGLLYERDVEVILRQKNKIEHIFTTGDLA